jgi:uncharacterized RDD family membrane protein YckC
VTCPKCGYVSYPGLPQCKKCGYRFVASEPNASPPGPAEVPHSDSSDNQVSPHEDTLPIVTTLPMIDTSPPDEPIANDIPEIPSTPLPTQATPAEVWREELAGKLEDHRRKRSRLRGSFDPSSSLDFEFGEQAGVTSPRGLDADLAAPSQSGSVLDAQLNTPRRDSSPFDGIPFEKPAEGIRVLTSAAVQAGESRLEEDDAVAQPVEIILESPPASKSGSSGPRAAGSLRVAPLGMRFAAGLLDTFILLVGAGLFALIFFIVGGRATLGPLNLAVFGSIATLFVLAYFGLFCALTSSTPGLLMLNLEFRSLEGVPPSPAESFWRAFGYLVSSASLMLGFAWALVDGDHLTWHDHISGTYITTIEH